MAEPNIIDWEKISTIEDVARLSKALVFDEAEVKQPSDMLKLNPNLSEEEIEDAFFWKDYVRGLMLVTGEPGAGKGIFMHMAAKKMNHYFGKVVVTDTRPRESFGICIPFSSPMLVEQIARMSEVETGLPRPIIFKGLGKGDFKDNGESWKEYKESNAQDKYQELCNRGLVTGNVTFKEYDSRHNEFITIPNFKPHVDNVTGKWISSRGEVFLRNSVMLLDEFGSKYMPRMRPNLSISQALLSLFNFWRHLHCLILGVGVTIEDFNTRSLDKANWETKCVRLNNKDYEYSDNPEDVIIKVNIDPIKYNPFTQETQKAGKGARLIINASEPKTILQGKCWTDIFCTDNAQGYDLPSKMTKRRQ